MTNSKQFSGGVSVLVLAAALVVSMTGAHAEEEVVDISTIEELQKIGKDEEFPLDGHYVLIDDIDASGLDNFEPIGDSSVHFTGVFDGNGHLITGLTINQPAENYVGLFGYVGAQGEVRNVTLEDCSVEGGIAVGGLVGRNQGTISESHTNVDVRGHERVGGLVGLNYKGDLSESYATGGVTATGHYVGGLVGHDYRGAIVKAYATSDVIGENNYVGGLVGRNEESVVSQSYADVDVKGRERVGGLVGWNDGGPVEESYATGSVTGDDLVGGLIGVNAGGNAQVTNTYATGPVTGGRRVGGLVGHTTTYSAVRQSYSTGTVTGDEEVGGLVGNTLGTAVVEASFWDIETSGQSISAGGDGVDGKSTEQMQTGSTFTGAGWDFDAIWAIDEGNAYPHLLNNPPPMDEEVFGDVTGSGEVSATDLQVVINGVLGLDDEADHDPDVNGDGDVDALDVQLVILVLLGLLG